MAANHCALCGSTGRFAIGVFQTLSAGNTGQLGAPGTGVLANAARDVAPITGNKHSTPVTTNAVVSLLIRRLTGAPPLPPPTVPNPWQLTRPWGLDWAGVARASESSGAALGGAAVLVRARYVSCYQSRWRRFGASRPMLPVETATVLVTISLGHRTASEMLGEFRIEEEGRVPRPATRLPLCPAERPVTLDRMSHTSDPRTAVPNNERRIGQTP